MKYKLSKGEVRLEQACGGHGLLESSDINIFNRALRRSAVTKAELIKSLRDAADKLELTDTDDGTSHYDASVCVFARSSEYLTAIVARFSKPAVWKEKGTVWIDDGETALTVFLDKTELRSPEKVIEEAKKLKEETDARPG